MLVLTETGANGILSSYFSRQTLTMALMSNDREVSGGGYNRKTITPQAWSVVKNMAMASEQVFQFTGPLANKDTITGYEVRDTNGKVVWTEKTTDFQPMNNGDMLKISPRIWVNL